MADEATKHVLTCLIVFSWILLAGAKYTTTESPRADEYFTAAAISVAAYVVPIVVFVVCAGSFSLISFIVCWCKNRNKPKIEIGPTDKIPPPGWVETIEPHPEIVGSGFAACSDGIVINSPTEIRRCRETSIEVDGARWSKGLTFGKHVFEIDWPRQVRGPYASIGVGHFLAPLNAQPNTTLVGMTTMSHGLDIVRRRVIHNGEVKCTCPERRNEFVPDKFYMYVDCDSGKLAWGSENRYWGVHVSQINRGLYPLYVMVGVGYPGAVVKVTYKGTAVDSPFSINTALPEYSPETPAPPYTLLPGDNEGMEKQHVPDPSQYTTPNTPPPSYRELTAQTHRT